MFVTFVASGQTELQLKPKTFPASGRLVAKDNRQSPWFHPSPTVKPILPEQFLSPVLIVYIHHIVKHQCLQSTDTIIKCFTCSYYQCLWNMCPYEFCKHVILRSVREPRGSVLPGLTHILNYSTFNSDWNSMVDWISWVFQTGLYLREQRYTHYSLWRITNHCLRVSYLHSMF